jgi:metal-responsive CopG/Arc/MetJ family transcriptional regulator
MTMAKAKVSVTVDRSLLRKCDRVARGASRSEVFERALERWLLDLRRRSLDEDVERYYSSLTKAERAEDSEWAGIAPRVLGETWA